MASEPEYLDMNVYLNQANDAQKQQIHDFFRGFFQAHEMNGPLSDAGLELFIMLGLLHPARMSMRCMGYVYVPGGKGARRCQHMINSNELCSNMQQLYDTARSGTLQGQDLWRAIFGLAKHFLCQAIHRKGQNGRPLMAEQLANDWFPIFLQFREYHPELY